VFGIKESHVNRILKQLSLLAILASMQPAPAIAERYTVQVKDNFFNPNELVINAGDTVVWKSVSDASCDPYDEGCSEGTAHTVTADDNINLYELLNAG
jgi:hypothetical protein